MKVYVSTDHDSFWVGGASVVVAPSAEEARVLLRDELATHGLSGATFSLTELDTQQPAAWVLRNGDY